MTTVTNNTTPQAQLMLLLQQLAQSNPINADQNANSQNDNTAPAASTGPSLTGGSPLFSSDTFVLLVQTQESSPDANTSSGQTTAQQSAFGQDFQQLAQAIQSGNLSAAQQAYAAVSQDISNFDQNNPSATSSNPVLTALNQIGSDLQSGNITGAQQTLSSLQQTQGAHHHHGGVGGDVASGDSTSSSSSSSSSSTPGTVTETNADGSITTIATNPDGSVTTTTTPPPTQTSANGMPNANSLQDLLAALQQLGIS